MRHIEDISEISDVVEKHHYYSMLLNPEIDHDIMASVVHLADSVSIRMLSGEKDFNQMETIKRSVVNSNEFLEKAKFAFEKISKKKGFLWTEVDENTVYDEFERDLEENPLSNSDLQSLGDILMYMTDVKSRFTTFHLERIAYVSKLLAEREHLGEERAMEVF